MSASTLLRSTKIREELLPAVQASTTFVPRTTGGDAKVGLDVPGYVGGGLRTGGGTGVLTLLTGTSSDPGTVKTALTGFTDGRVMLGDATNTGTAKVVATGASGTSKIFNQIYDPVIENFSTPWIASLSTSSTPINQTFSFPVTGMYALSVKITVPTGVSLPTNAITYYVENEFTKTIIPTTTNTIAPGSLITVADSGVGGPIQFNYLHFGYLQRFNSHNFVMTSYDPAWTDYIDVAVSWSQMC